MESTLFYDETEDKAKADTALLGIDDLDPVNEVSFDLRLFLENHSTINFDEHSELFPELQPSSMSQKDVSLDSWPEDVKTEVVSPIFVPVKTEAVTPIFVPKTPTKNEDSHQLTSSRSLKAPSSRRRSQITKDSEEYLQRRAKNNVAVRKSRDKTKLRQIETEAKVRSLTEDNEELVKKVDLLTKELTVLKGLFVNVGVQLPKDISKFIE